MHWVYSIQFSSVLLIVSNSLWPHVNRNTPGTPCLSPTPRVHQIHIMDLWHMIRVQYSLAIIIIVLNKMGLRTSPPPCTDWLLASSVILTRWVSTMEQSLSCCSPVEIASSKVQLSCLFQSHAHKSIHLLDYITEREWLPLQYSLLRRNSMDKEPFRLQSRSPKELDWVRD